MPAAPPCCWSSRTPTRPCPSPTTATCSRRGRSRSPATASSSSRTTACAAPTSASDDPRDDTRRGRGEPCEGAPSQRKGELAMKKLLALVGLLVLLGGAAAWAEDGVTDKE